ncbi:TetR/AcrR family transcriptional regulator [uncultured Friedmanniella sp.]|uniref:TetR/AcrR family transcriptional regulator n=1 Tax=uncultured Friedmanniella sp. TaxID=335381 RepID=UPI0035C9D52A
MSRADVTHHRVLDAAETLFFREGIAITGMDKVAGTADVAIATLYKHFGSKDNLLREVLARRLDAWVSHWDAAIAAAGSSERRLLAIFDAVESFRAASGSTQWCCFLATASERAVPEAGTSDPVFEVVGQDSRLVNERLAELVDELGCPHPSALVATILVLYNGVLSSLLRGTPTDPVTHARRAAQLLIRSAADLASTVSSDR